MNDEKVLTTFPSLESLSKIKQNRTSRIDEVSFPNIFYFYDEIDQAVLFVLYNLAFFLAPFVNNHFQWWAQKNINLIAEPSLLLQNAFNAKNYSKKDFIKALIGKINLKDKTFCSCLATGDPYPLKQLLLGNMDLVKAILAFKSIKPCIITKWYHDKEEFNKLLMDGIEQNNNQREIPYIIKDREQFYRENFLKVLKNNTKPKFKEFIKKNKLLCIGESKKDVELLWSIFFTMGEFETDTPEYKFLNDSYTKISSYLKLSPNEVRKNILDYLGKIFETNSKYFFLVFKNIPEQNFKEGYKLLRDIYNLYKDIDKDKDNKKDSFISERQSLKKFFFEIYSFKDEKYPNSKIIEYFGYLPESDKKYYFRYFEPLFYNKLLFDKSSPKTPLLFKIIINKILELELKKRLLANGLSDGYKKILNKKILYLKEIYIDLIVIFSKKRKQEEPGKFFNRLEQLLEKIKNLQTDDSVKTFFYTKNWFSASESRKLNTLELLDYIEKFIENFWYGKIKNYIFKSKDIKDSKVNKKSINKNKQIQGSAGKHDKLFPIELINLSKQIENLKTRMNNFHSEAALKVLKQKQHYLQTTFRLLFNYHMNKSSENLERLAMYLESLHGNKIIKTYSYGCFVSSYAFFKPKKTNTEFLLDSINDFVKKADNIRRLSL